MPRALIRRVGAPSSPRRPRLRSQTARMQSSSTASPRGSKRPLEKAPWREDADDAASPATESPADPLSLWLQQQGGVSAQPTLPRKAVDELERPLPAELQNDAALLALFRTEFGLSPEFLLSPEKMRQIRRLYGGCSLMKWQMRCGKTISSLLVVLLRWHFDKSSTPGRLLVVAVCKTETAKLSWDNEGMRALRPDTFIVEHLAKPDDLLTCLAALKARARKQGRDAVLFVTYHQLQTHFKRVAEAHLDEVALFGQSAYGRDTIRKLYEHPNLTWNLLHALTSKASLDMHIDFLILDEAPMAGDVGSQTGIATRLLAAGVELADRLLLTGTPARANKPQDSLADLVQLVSCHNRKGRTKPTEQMLAACAARFWSLTLMGAEKVGLRHSARHFLNKMTSSLTLKQAYPEKMTCEVKVNLVWVRLKQPREKVAYLARESEFLEKAHKMLNVSSAAQAQQSRKKMSTVYVMMANSLQSFLILPSGALPDLLQRVRETVDARDQHLAVKREAELHPAVGTGPPTCCNPSCPHRTLDRRRHVSEVSVGSRLVLCQFPMCRMLKMTHYLCEKCDNENTFVDCPRCMTMPPMCYVGWTTQTHLKLEYRESNTPEGQRTLFIAPSTLMRVALEEVERHLSNRKPDEGKYIVVAHRKTEAVVFASLLTRRRPSVNVLVLTGDVKGVETLQAFKTDPKYTVLVALPQKICTGIDLSVADKMFLLWVDWNVSSDRQLTARITGPDQKGSPKVYKFMVAGTIQEAMFWNAKGSMKYQQSVLEGQSMSSTSESCRMYGHLRQIVESRPHGEVWPAQPVLSEVQTRLSAVAGRQTQREDELEDEDESFFVDA